MLREVYNVVPQFAVNGIQLLRTCKRKPFLEALEELLDFLLRGLADFIKLDFIIVKAVNNWVREVLVERAAKILTGLVWQGQFVSEELPNGHQPLLAVNDFERLRVVGHLQ